MNLITGSLKPMSKQYFYPKRSIILKKSIFIATFGCFSMISMNNHAAEYYKWVDSKGSTHYTTTPPPNGAKKQGKIATYGSSNRSKDNQGSQTSNPTEAPSGSEQLSQEVKSSSAETTSTMPSSTN